MRSHSHGNHGDNIRYDTIANQHGSTTNQALKVAEAIAQATPFCSTYLSAVHTNIAGIPQKLGTYASIVAEASSVCSCLLHSTTATTTTAATQPTTTQATLVTCPSSCSLANTKTVTSVRIPMSNHVIRLAWPGTLHLGLPTGSEANTGSVKALYELLLCLGGCLLVATSRVPVLPSFS